jgi:hypothetical protein
MGSVKVTCNYCGQEVKVIMYFNNEKILVSESFREPGTKYYGVMCYGDALCPMCGATIHARYDRTLYREDIIKLAVGEDNDSN